MSYHVESPTQPGLAIHQLIGEALCVSTHDRRSEPRYPFFRRISVRMNDGRRSSAFTREISASGIGLVHNFELLPGEVELSIPSERGCVVRVRTRIVWCQPCGDGWFLSGGQFIGVTPFGQ
jgi:hypothetical protein